MEENKPKKDDSKKNKANRKYQLVKGFDIVDKPFEQPVQTVQILPRDISEIIVIRSLCLFDEFQKKSIKINSKPFTIGRDQKNLLIINSAMISSNQCEIISLEDFAFIFDKGSLNGTFIKLLVLKPMLLKKNMIFEIGKNLYLFEKEKKKKTLIMKGYEGIHKGESIIELNTIDEKSKIVLIGKKKIENTKMVHLEDESLDDEHALILIKNEKFYLMPLESKAG